MGPDRSRIHPGKIRDALPTTPPKTETRFDEIVSYSTTLLLPRITHWNHPEFFAYFAISVSASGVLAEFLTAALSTQAMLWLTIAPAITELKAVSLGGFRQLLGRPDSFDGIVYDTTSIASLHNLAAHELTVPDVNTKDSTGQDHLTPMSIDVSEQPHSSIDKAAITLGLGQDALRKISVNG